tara:strand:+ start:2398 stop:2595 length:198 start_codon:yes stop_codon:yes gene_type:complete
MLYPKGGYMSNKEIFRYNSKHIQDMRVKLNSGKYSDTWYRKHFVEMMRYIEWVNGENGGKNEKSM